MLAARQLRSVKKFKLWKFISYMRCKCGAEAVYKLNQYKLAFCNSCYPRFYESLVARNIKKYKMILPNEKVLVCISGGKDSCATLSALKALGHNVEALHINLGIKNFSKICKRVVLEIAKILDVKLHVVELKDYGFTIDAVRRKKICSVCGTAKRYLMNKFAREHDFDVIATGHNSEDITIFGIKNIINQNAPWLASLKPRAESFDPKIVTKIKPLFERTEKENLYYVKALDLPYVKERCPYTPKNKWYADKITLATIAQSFARGLARPIQNAQKRNYCKMCGELTNREICAFCKAIKRYSL